MTQHIVPDILPERMQHCRVRRVFAVGQAAMMASLVSLSAAAQRPCPPQLFLDDTTPVGGNQSCPMYDTPDTQNPDPIAGISDTPNYSDPMMSCSSLSARRTVNVANASALQQALANASCGDTIQLAPGTYGTSLAVDRSCAASAPVIIKGAPDFASTVTSGMVINGARTILTGVNFSGPNARVSLGGTNNKVLANRFSDWSGIAVTTVAGKQGEIAYNELFDPHPWLASEADGYPLRMGIRSAEKDSSTFHFDAWIHHNYFHDFPAKPTSEYHSGQSDAIEVCETNREWTYSTPAGWYIERNLVHKHLQGQGIVDIKCSGVVVRANTVTESPEGGLNIRGGVGSTLESNWQDTGGSSVHSANHRVVGNYMRSGGIRLISGDQPWNSGEVGAGHNQALGVLVAGNTAEFLDVGVAYDAAMETYPVQDTVIEAHKGPSPSLRVQQGTTIRSSTSARFAPAFQLGSVDVGPSALNGASPTYLQCRRP